MKTKNISMTRGTTYEFTETYRDPISKARVDLTGWKVHFAARADMKVDPSIKLTSQDPAPSGWRVGIVLADQTQNPGDYTVTITPSDTSSLVALGHDDPYLYEVYVVDPDGNVFPHISISQLDLYPQAGAVPS